MVTSLPVAVACDASTDACADASTDVSANACAAGSADVYTSPDTKADSSGDAGCIGDANFEKMLPRRRKGQQKAASQNTLSTARIIDPHV